MECFFGAGDNILLNWDSKLVTTVAKSIASVPSIKIVLHLRSHTETGSGSDLAHGAVCQPLS